MKVTNVLVAVVLFLSCPIAFAQQSESTQGNDDKSGSPTMMPRMMQHMEEMQKLMEDMSDIEDPMERRKLMEQHRQKMHAAMSAMRHMHGRGGSGMKGGMHSGAGKMKHGGRQHAAGKTDELRLLVMSTMETQREMGKRLDLLQTLIEQILAEQN